MKKEEERRKRRRRKTRRSSNSSKSSCRRKRSPITTYKSCALYTIGSHNDLQCSSLSCVIRHESDLKIALAEPDLHGHSSRC